MHRKTGEKFGLLKQAANSLLTQPGAEVALQRVMHDREMPKKLMPSFRVRVKGVRMRRVASVSVRGKCRSVPYRIERELARGEERIQSLLHDILC